MEYIEKLALKLLKASKKKVSKGLKRLSMKSCEIKMTQL